MSNFFELLGLPPSFNVEPRQLDERYRALSQQWHPDRFTGASAKERIQALEMTTEINHAYKTLKDPLARAVYLLKLAGIDLDREDAGTTFQMDRAFLMEILELREQLDEAKQAKDVERALTMGQEIAAREKGTRELLEKLFAEQQAQPDAQRLKKLADQTAALRYFRRFQEEVSAIEEESLA